MKMFLEKQLALLQIKITQNNLTHCNLILGDVIRTATWPHVTLATSLQTNNLNHGYLIELVKDFIGVGKCNNISNFYQYSDLLILEEDVLQEAAWHLHAI